MKESTVFMLLYGDYHDLHRTVLTPLAQQDTERLDVRLWLNVVCLDTIKSLADNAPSSWLLYVADQNVPKYRAMARMFHDDDHPISTPWITWFDDDSIIKKGNWLNKTLEFIEQNPHVALFGYECVKRHMSGIDRWIKQASWYRNRAFQKIHKKLRGIRFIQGCYWWLRQDALRRVDWPDSRLSHNGGDTALSEAMWQQGFNQADFTYGVDVDTVERRGMTERPAGSKHERAYHSDNSVPLLTGGMASYKGVLDAAERAFVPIITTTAVSTRRGRTVVKHVIMPAKPKLVTTRAISTGRQVTTSYLSRPVPAAPQRRIRSIRSKTRPKTRPKKSLKALLQERTHARHGR